MEPLIVALIPNEKQLAILIPIVAIVMGCAIPIVFLIMDALRKKSLFELHHRERLAALERGLPVPPLPEGLLEKNSPTARHPTDTLRRGLIWLFVGIALYFALPPLAGHDKGYIGFIPAAIGLANLVFYATVGRKLSTPSCPTEPEKPTQ